MYLNKSVVTDILYIVVIYSTMYCSYVEKRYPSETVIIKEDLEG